MLTPHLDEGTIHAWLDGALGAADAARVEAHVAGCEVCSEAVAEARGLIAGASRVVGKLDDGVATGMSGPDMNSGAERAVHAGRPATASRFRVTPARAAIAATLLVVAGITVTRGWIAQDSAIIPPPTASAPASAVAPHVGPPSIASPQAHDPLLDSAIARNIAKASPPRALEKAPGPDVPSAPPAPTPAQLATVDSSAPLRVAEGRNAVTRLRDSAPVATEQTFAKVATPKAAAGLSARTAGADVAMAPRAAMKREARREAPVFATEVPLQCLIIDSPAPGARLGSLPLPLSLSLGGMNPDSGDAFVIGVDRATNRALHPQWRRVAHDSVRVTIGSEARVVPEKQGRC